MTAHLRLAGAAVAAIAIAAAPYRAEAQREIVQALPPEGSAALNDALTRLARNSRDIPALLDAGEAALMLGDIDAAIGFFGRAKELSPDESRVKVGLAKAYTRSRRPIEALRLFADAERAGVDNARMAEDRALAFDLVGDARSAQQLYQLALSRGGNEEVRRRLALSQAISGNRAAFEQTLLPLLEKRDLAAFRTRAFGLAILGDTKEAIKISDAMLPPAMATRIRPYLEYMPRLTQAQQAAAGTLGIFPRAANIGTDDPQIASYTAAEPQGPSQQAPVKIAQADPAREDPRTQERRRRPDRTRSRSDRTPGALLSRSRQSQPAVATVAAPPPAAAQARVAEATSPPPPPAPPPPPPPVPVQAAAQPQVRAVPAPTKELPAVSGPSLAQVVARQQTAASAPAPAPQPQVQPPAPRAEPQAVPPLPQEPVQPAPEPLPSLEEAFASFTLEPSPRPAAATGAVDITRIEIPREVAEPEPPKPPKPPAHPSRHWVQLATGKDRTALGFDWRRIARKAETRLDGKGPFVTPWGEANRLLAGPFKTAKDAREFMNELKALEIDSFTFTSDEGEAIDQLPRR